MVQDDSSKPIGSGAATADRHRSPFRLTVILVVGLALTTLAVCALYIPYLGNKLVFDDGTLFTSLAVFDYAQTPFNLYPRTFPYFTLGFTEVEWHSIEAHRIVSLVLHLLNAFMMFRLCKVLLEQIEGISAEKALWLALLAANLFALNPVAVYGAAYLVQRTIVLALLFSLLSAWFYLRALRKDRWTDCLTAALFYALAIYSKEHAIMLPAAVVALSPLVLASRRLYEKKAALYLAACLPTALWVIYIHHSQIGVMYEEFAGNTLLQMGAGMPLDTALGRWFVSAVTQMGLFFEYLRYWLLPDVRTMSIDMRIDFAALWTAPLIALRIVAFVACPFVALWLLQRRNRLALLGTGLLYAWLMYLPELSAVRFQEPFVLYRNYLWAPAYLLLALAPLSGLNEKVLIALAIMALPILFVSAEGRLNSFESELKVWQDARAKLPNDNIAGADRIYYNTAHELIARNRSLEALANLRQAVNMNPANSSAILLMGQAYFEQHDYGNALVNIDRSLQLDSANGHAHYARGLVLERLGRSDDAFSEFSRSLTLGVEIAQLKLQAMRSAR